MVLKLTEYDDNLNLRFIYDQDYIEYEDFFFVGIVQAVAGIEPTPLKLPVQTPLKSGRVISVSCDACGCVCCFLDLI